MAIEEVTMYRTPDGKTFEDKKKAKEHMTDKVCEYLDQSTKHLLGSKFTNSDQFRFISGLIPNYEAAVALRNELNKILGED